MAETAVGLVVDRLISLLSEEANLLRAVHKQVDEINRELRSIQAFLKDADQRAVADSNQDGVKLWVGELRKVAEKIEDAVDEYIQDIAEQRENQQEPNPLRRGFRYLLQSPSCFIVKLKPRHEIASKIRDLKNQVLDTNRRGRDYNFVRLDQTNPSTKSWSDPRLDATSLKETEVVGIQSEKKDLVARLKSPEHGVIALVGMGGIGKTTLANQVFEKAKPKFDCHAWVTVSQSYDKLELLRRLIKRFCASRNEFAPQGVDQEVDEQYLLKKMRDYLQGKTYLVVFDDVWDFNFLKYFQIGLPVEIGRLGKIVLTTRNDEVANSCAMPWSVHIHPKEFLSFENSLKLFNRKAFHGEDEKACPTDFVDLSREIVKKCEGLPLAIVVLGGLVATKDKNTNELRELLTRLRSELESNERLESINKILSLSYNDLPYNLKSCFLYLGIFPEDYSVDSYRLVWLWIAEGFVKPIEGKTKEDVAKQHLAELISRSMIQVSCIDDVGDVRDCRIHDLVREFILTKMKDLNICKVVSKDDSCDFKNIAARRVSIFHGSGGAFTSSDIPKIRHIRSVFSFDKEENMEPLVSAIVLNLKLVRVLDFEDCQGLDILHDDIGNLFHLRYLNVNGTRVKILPRSIGKLENLETLDLEKSLVYELPVEVNKLCKLRHLLAYQEDMYFSFNQRRGVKIKKGFGNLKALEKLYMIEANVEGVDVIEEVSKLRELRKLGIDNLRSEEGSKLCECIEGLKCLESLELHSVSEDEVIECQFISSPPQWLQSLSLAGRLSKFPEWIRKLKNLVRITLCWSKLEEDPLKPLRHLPNLLIICIYEDAYYGEKVEIEKTAFPKLKSLSFYNLSRLNSLIIEEGALPNLERLYIEYCPQLKKVSNGLCRLSKLKELIFNEMPLDFVLFNHFHSLSFVPIVKFQFTLNGKTFFWALEDVLKIQEYVKEHDEEDWHSITSYHVIMGLKNLWKRDSKAPQHVLSVKSMDCDTVSETPKTFMEASGRDCLQSEKPKHDVFLSISSEDMNNNGFTSHLCAALRSNGITTYSYNGSESGDEILPEVVRAIQESRLCLVIFTKHYAVSTWRHNELKHILRLNESLGDQFLVPVYYDVDSSSVTEQLEHYQAYFAQKKGKIPMDDSDKDHSSDVVLTKAASLSCWDSNVVRPESKLIEEIVEDIFRKLKRIPPITDFDGLVGIPDQLEEIEPFFKFNSPKVTIIGILGVGGIGKTSLAKVLFDGLSMQFEACCFVGDSKESWESGRKKYLQEKLVSGLEGKKVLIVVDDIEEEEQFKLLFKDPDRYGAGSRILVTSRHKTAIEEADSIYEMTELSFSDALLLFKQNAFRKSSFTEELLQLSEAVVHSLENGNPLSIKLVGSALDGKSSETWHKTIRRLRNVQSGEIQNVLRICFDLLEEDAKKVFLDVACFFIGSDEEFVKQILDGCWSGAPEAMRDLLEMSVITAPDFKLQMHDLIKDLGKNIVIAESVKEPGQRSRLWDAQDIYHVFENNTETDAVEAIFLNMCKISKLKVGPTAFSKMKRLRMLKLHSYFANCTLQFNEGDLEFLSSELRYLYWDAYPFESMPSSFTGNKLVELRLRYSKVKQLWKIPQELENLKALDLSFSKELIEIPNLSRARQLETLILSGCKSLSQVPSYVQHLSKLVTLDLEDCSSLEAVLALPDDIIHVNLARCINLTSLPSNISDLKSLRLLDLAGCLNFDFTKFNKFPTTS